MDYNKSTIVIKKIPLPTAIAWTTEIVVKDEVQRTNICRLCMSDDEPQYSMFDVHQSKLKYYEMANTLLETEVSEDDFLPTNICEDCLSKLILFYKFKIQCIKTRRTLLKNFDMTGSSHASAAATELIVVENVEDIDNKLLIQKIHDSQNEEENKINRTESVHFDHDYGDDFVDDEDIEMLDEEESETCDVVPVPLALATSEKIAQTHLVIERVEAAATSSQDFVCQKCGLVLYTKDAFTFHEKQHNKPFPNFRFGSPKDKSGEKEKERPFECMTCSMRFTRKTHLQQHETIHDNIKPHVCDIGDCQRAFRKASDLTRHRTVHSNLRPFECPACDKKFKRQTDINSHLKTHSDEKYYKCKYQECDKSYASFSGRKKHYYLEHGEKSVYCCHICGLTLLTKDAMDCHINTHYGIKPHACTMCDSKFTRKVHLVNHIRIHTNTKPYKCKEPDCEKAFIKSGDLQRHAFAHIKEKKFKCQICPSTFKHPSGVQKHMKLHNSFIEIKCKYENCQVTFRSYGRRNRHLMRDHNETPDRYRCYECGVRLSCAISLKEHQLRHMGFRAHNCDICDKKFIRPCDLKKHKMIHTNIKPFNCQFEGCNKTFRTSGNRKKHMKVHEKKSESDDSDEGYEPSAKS